MTACAPSRSRDMSLVVTVMAFFDWNETGEGRPAGCTVRRKFPPTRYGDPWVATPSGTYPWYLLPRCFPFSVFTQGRKDPSGLGRHPQAWASRLPAMPRACTVHSAVRHSQSAVLGLYISSGVPLAVPSCYTGSQPLVQWGQTSPFALP